MLNKKYSLIPPFDENTTSEWVLKDLCTFNEDTIMLTNRTEDEKGSIWNKYSSFSTSWKIELNYRAEFDSDFEQLFPKFADGIAFWYVPPITDWNFETYYNSYGGSNPEFVGLMIAIDDYQLLGSNTSAVVVVYNEVARWYNWNTEGHDIRSGRCLMQHGHGVDPDSDELVIEYVNKTLNVYHTSNGSHLELCVSVDNLSLPAEYSFGISASTGGIKGHFSVKSFKFYDMIRSDKDGDQVIANPTTELPTDGPNPVEELNLRQIIYIVVGILILSMVLVIAFLILKRRRVDNHMELQAIPIEVKT